MLQWNKKQKNMIKLFEEFVNESKLPTLPTNGDNVKGVDGGEYVVLDTAKASDKVNVEKLLNAYDSSGAMRQELGNLPHNAVLVALEDEDKCYSVWQWSDKWLKMA
jgi:glutamate mutase epsilon subunit